MNCPEVKELLSPFIDDELETVETAAIKAHLIRCESCRKERDKLERMGTALRNLPPVTVPKGFEFDLYARLRDTAQLRSLPARSRLTRIAVPFAAMIVGVLLGSASIPRWITPVSLVADRSTDNTTLATNPYQVVTDNGDIVEYTLDDFAPMNADGNRLPSQPNVTLASGNTLSSGHSERYVLDPMPMRASYERIVY